MRAEAHSLVTFSDGGCRQGTCSSSAWAVTAGTHSMIGWSFSILAAGGTFLDKEINSFHGEAVALEEAVETSDEILTRLA